MQVNVMFRKFLRHRAGATAIEYSLIAAGVAGAIAAIVFTLGSTVAVEYSNVVAAFK